MLRKTEVNNHTILEKRFPYDEFFDYVEVVRPGYLIGSSKPYYRRLLMSIGFALMSCVRILKKGRGQKILFREFDVTALIYMFIPFSISIVFNVNHNMSGFFSRVVCRVLSLRYTLVMLDGGDEFRKKYSYVQCLDSISIQNKRKCDKPSGVVLICGSRIEQREFDQAEYDELKSFVLDKKIPFSCLGNNYEVSEFVSQEELIKMFSFSMVVVFFGRRYLDRHSGSVWTAAEYAPCMVVPENEVFINQSKSVDRVHVYATLGQIKDAITAEFKGGA